jgi:hypothetical protein
VAGYVGTLRGTTDLTAGEPRFDGTNFFNKQGDKLTSLTWFDNVPDIPGKLVVMDLTNMKAWLGNWGGFVANGPFRGFGESVGIEKPDALDLQNYKMQPDGSVIDTADNNQPLKKVGGWDPKVADVPGESFFYEKDTSKVVGFRTGGMIGVPIENYRIDMGARAPIKALE